MNKMTQNSPVINEERDVSVPTDGSIGKQTIPQSGKQPSFSHLFVTCSSGSVTVRFYDEDGNEIVGTNEDRKSLEAGEKWDYDFGIGTATPSDYDIHDESGGGSNVDHRLERSTAS